MSGDEAIVVLAGLIVLARFVGPWVVTLAMPRLVDSSVARRGLAIGALAALAIVYLVLVNLAASDVRDSPTYVGMYLVLGGAWIALGTSSLPAMGLDPLVDGIERRNLAAIPGSVGAFIGIALCFAGANIGEGPGWWVVIFCAVVSTGAWFLAWTVLNGVSHLTDTVTIDRDGAAGIRLGAVLVGLGAILGRAVAGNWVSAAATLADFIRFAAGPTVLLVAAECAVGFVTRPRPDRPQASPLWAGWIPGIAYVGVAVAEVRALGWPR